MTPVLLHLPHDSTVIPSADRADYLISAADLGLEQLRLTDWHTAALYAEGMPTDEIVCAEVSRLVVDVERFADDRLERCSAFGMGATYVQTCDGRPLRVLSPERRAELLDRYYWPHHRRLDEAVSAKEILGQRLQFRRRVAGLRADTNFQRRRETHLRR